MSDIEIKALSNIYGPVSSQAIALLKQGVSSDVIQDKTGQLVSLNNINLTIKHGEFHVIMGLSGSGKSTFLRHLNGLLKPTLGHVYVNEEDITQYNKKQLNQFRKQQVSMVFQHYGLLPHFNVYENVAFGVMVQSNWRRSDFIESNVTQWIEKVGLEGFEEAYPCELSGGMQQRVGLARALATEADILLLDEAFSGLDPLIRREMQDLLLNIESQMTRTIVFITHDLDEALKLGDKVTILHQGIIAQTDTPVNIVQNPANDYVKQFVEHVNLSQVITAGTAQQPCLTVTADVSIDEVIALLQQEGSELCFVQQKNGVHVLTLPQLLEAKKTKETSVTHYMSPAVTVPNDTILEQVLPLTLKTDLPLAVVDAQGVIVGKLSRKSIITALTQSI